MCRSPQGNPNDAIRRIEHAGGVNSYAWGPGLLAYSHGAAGDHDSAEAILEELLRPKDSRVESQLGLALAFFGAGRLEEALESLDRAIGRHEPNVAYIPAMPVFDALQGDDRFEALVDRLRRSSQAGSP